MAKRTTKTSGTRNAATQSTETAEAKPTAAEKREATEEQFATADHQARRAVTGF